MGGLLVAFLILVILILAVVVSCIKIVPQAHAYIVERLGGYLATWPVGLHLLIPFIDRVAKKVTLKEQVVDFPPQPVITKDNVTMQIDTVVYFQITDPKPLPWRPPPEPRPHGLKRCAAAYWKKA